jgi:hypothetical protein
VHTPAFFKGIPFRARAAEAVKNGPAEIHAETLPPDPVPGGHKPLIQKGGESFGIRAGEIRHPAAAAAHEMRMGFYVPVKPFLPVHNTQGNHQPFLPEEADVPVYRTQGKAGDNRFKLIIHPLGSWVGQGGPDHLQNGVPFFAVFPLGDAHILIIITIIKICKINLKKIF